MEFRTKVDIPVPPFLISHSDKMLMIGSCFTENIGNYLLKNQFKVNINPFGIIYNPLSIFNNLNRIINKQLYSEDDLLFQNELYLSLDHHGSFSHTDKNKAIEKINAGIKKGNSFFADAGHIQLTLGTSFVYTYIPKNKIVANCHKIPNTAFEKRILSIEEIVASFDQLQPKMKNKKVVFTISPVRHWRDGAIENQHSKSILTESIHRIISKYDNCFYFPAYEIVMDELRDYRFYEEDMLHPNEVAVKYIWKRFCDTYFSEETKKINIEIEKINLLLQHRIKHENALSDDFNKKVKATIDEFKKKHPDFDLNF